MTDARKITAAAKATGASDRTDNKEQNAGNQTAGDAESLLKSDHRNVERLFQQYESADDNAAKRELANKICLELIVHTKLEEEIFYSACREKEVDDDLLDEAQVEHDGAKVLIAELLSGSPDDAYYDAKVSVLSEYIKHHVAEEEKPDDGIFAKARKAGVDMGALGTRIQSRKTELMARSDALMSRAPQPLSLHNPAMKRGQNRQEDYSMPRYSNDRERDEMGRFTSEDDRRDYRSRGYASRGRYDEDDDYRGYRGNEHPRDEEGRFVSGSNERYRDRDEYAPRSSRYRNDDDYRLSRGNSGRGWYGDSEGHSQASERGWEGQGSSRGEYSSRNGDYSSRNGDYPSRDIRQDRDQDYRGSRETRGHGGWFGDSEGHSEASERGWESRGSSRGGSARGPRHNDEDDNRTSRSSGRNHGGWYGDPRGHSEAARRGWEDR